MKEAAREMVTRSRAAQVFPRRSAIPLCSIGWCAWSIHGGIRGHPMNPPSGEITLAS